MRSIRGLQNFLAIPIMNPLAGFMIFVVHDDWLAHDEWLGDAASINKHLRLDFLCRYTD